MLYFQGVRATENGIWLYQGGYWIFSVPVHNVEPSHIIQNVPQDDLLATLCCFAETQLPIGLFDNNSPLPYCMVSSSKPF